MELLSNLALGLEATMTVTNLLYCLIGVFLGTAVGVLPGLGPIATIAMLLPATFSSCLPASTTAPPTAARPPPSW
jgi:TctA family transporter